MGAHRVKASRGEEVKTYIELRVVETYFSNLYF